MKCSLDHSEPALPRGQGVEIQLAAVGSTHALELVDDELAMADAPLSPRVASRPTYRLSIHQPDVALTDQMIGIAP